MTGAALLVVAKAPVPGRVKTRLGAVVGHERAADLAAAAFLDTLDVCATAAAEIGGTCHLALDGDLGDAVCGPQVAERLSGWSVFAQEGDGLGDRLAHAHRTVGERTGRAVVQVGMDTPHLSAPTLRDLVDATQEHGVAIGPAEDGGWWGLGVCDGRWAHVLAEVPMSTDRTCLATEAALAPYAGAAGQESVARVSCLRDVDTVEDAVAVAAAHPHTLFARTWVAGHGG